MSPFFFADGIEHPVRECDLDFQHAAIAGLAYRFRLVNDAEHVPLLFAAGGDVGLYLRALEAFEGCFEEFVALATGLAIGHDQQVDSLETHGFIHLLALVNGRHAL